MFSIALYISDLEVFAHGLDLPEKAQAVISTTPVSNRIRTKNAPKDFSRLAEADRNQIPKLLSGAATRCSPPCSDILGERNLRVSLSALSECFNRNRIHNPKSPL
jgi:hypothetical protein